MIGCDGFGGVGFFAAFAKSHGIVGPDFAI
jgi:hypothetical protein